MNANQNAKMNAEPDPHSTTLVEHGGKFGLVFCMFRILITGVSDNGWKTGMWDINSLPLTCKGKICKNLPMIKYYIPNQRCPFRTKFHYSHVIF
jgi:hypothetical protein